MTLYRPSRCPFCDNLLTCESDNDLAAVNHWWTCPTKLTYQHEDDESVLLPEYSVSAFGQKMLAEYVRFPEILIKIHHDVAPTGTGIFSIIKERAYRSVFQHDFKIRDEIREPEITTLTCTTLKYEQIWRDNSTKIFDLGYPLAVVEQKLKMLLTFS